MKTDHIQELLSQLPATPGIYKFKDLSGQVLYVGKAKNLSRRVRSYFRSEKNRIKRTEKLIEQIEDIEWIEVKSDWEALMLETNLIKELRPKYNVLMKDDKNFVYIKITKNEDYPRIKIVRRVLNDGAKYFGPKTAANRVKKTLLLMQKLFMYRSCDLKIEWLENDKAKVSNKTIAYPCLDFHIKRCAAPCVGKISPSDYRKSIDKIESFLSGKTADIEAQLTEEITTLAENKEFERAALLRDKLLAVQDLMKSQVVTSSNQEDIDVFGFVLDQGKAYFNLFQIRSGKLIGHENFLADAPGYRSGDEASAATLLESFLFQYYQKATDIAAKVLVPLKLDDDGFFADWYSNALGKRAKVTTPQRGVKNELTELAQKNALSFMKQHKARWAGFTQDDKAAVDELTRVLKLEKAAKRIECYDISHLSGTDTVASMVVFKDGVAQKSDYRHFRLKTIEKGEIDDFKSMKEVLYRRLAYLMKFPEGYVFRRSTKKALKEICERIDGLDYESLAGDRLKDIYVLMKDKKLAAWILVSRYGSSLFIQQIHFFDEAGESSKQLLFSAMSRYLCDKNKAKRLYSNTALLDKKILKTAHFQKINKKPRSYELYSLDDTQNSTEQALPSDESIEYFALDPNDLKDSSFSKRPDLIVIDGGKGQLSSALKSRNELGLDIPMISLAKREEELFLPGQSLPLLIPVDSEASKLLQRLRNEAHRFAITFQKKSRKKYLTSSELDHITGVGDLVKMKLLKHFKSLSKVKEASEEDLAKVIGPSMAKKIKTHFMEV
jgi:excinuclease ABC subunit C